MKTRLKIAVMLALPLFAVNAVADDNARADNADPRRWAVRAGFGMTGFRLANDGSGFKQKTAFSSPEFSFGLEYYIPHSKFSITAGYDYEPLEQNDGDNTYSIFADMYNLSIGGRYYPIAKKCFFQPYAGIETSWNLNPQKNEWEDKSYDGKQKSKWSSSLPVLSVAPKVGFDVYLLSCLALEIDYAYRLGAGGKIDIASQYDGNREVYTSHTHVNRHNFGFGLKATFPFRITNKDVDSLIGALLLIFDPSSIEQDNQTDKTMERSRKIKDVISKY